MQFFSVTVMWLAVATTVELAQVDVLLLVPPASVPIVGVSLDAAQVSPMRTVPFVKVQTVTLPPE